MRVEPKITGIPRCWAIYICIYHGWNSGLEFAWLPTRALAGEGQQGRNVVGWCA